MGGGWQLDDQENYDSTRAKNLRSRGGGSPPMVIEQVTIQLGVKNVKSSGGVAGGLGMIEKVIIQVVAKHLKVAGGVGGRQPPHDDPESDDSIRAGDDRKSDDL